MKKLLLLVVKAMGKNKTNPSVSLPFAHKRSNFNLSFVADAGIINANFERLTVEIDGLNTLPTIT